MADQLDAVEAAMWAASARIAELHNAAGEKKADELTKMRAVLYDAVDRSGHVYKCSSMHMRDLQVCVIYICILYYAGHIENSVT